ncbi:MAG: 1,4-dihydroxy-2-naphthoate octaprenyltransferase, partial [Chthoniobacterales bacterium]
MPSLPMNPWILAARPRTLGAAIVPVLAGCALAFAAGAFGLLASMLALTCAVFIQIATNYFNDAIDHAKGADTAERLGPVRATSAGLLTPRSMMTGGVVCLIIAAILAIPLVLHGGWPILALGIVSLLLAYAYTGGPFPLAYLGLGEIFVVLFFGVFAVAGIFYLNALEWSLAAVLAGLQIGLHSSVLLAVNNLRDLETDRAANKHTLAARFGLTFARRENATLVIAPFVLGILWLPLGYFWAFLLPLMT